MSQVTTWSDNFRCPDCRGNLESLGTSGVGCASCKAKFPLAQGVVWFAPRGGYVESFALQWSAFPRTQLDSVTGLPVTENRFFETTRWPKDLKGQRILEAGCGAGRFTEILCMTGADVFSFDYSRAVEVNQKNNSGFHNLTLFQADIRWPPFEPDAFDRVCCLGVLQHTPDPEESFRSLARLVRPGGELAVDIYRRSFLAMVSWKYILRPITTRLRPDTLFRLIQAGVPLLLPVTRLLRAVAGRAGARLSPIVEYSHLGLGGKANLEWAILDTFDMYSPKHDHPKTEADVRRWFAEAGFIEIHVGPGANGVIGRGRRPVRA